eukprot:7938069-Pyramimonas_sp.AAC.1
MRFPHPGQRFVAPSRAPPKAPAAALACCSPTQGNSSWPHRELHRRPQLRSSHAVPPPRAALRGLIGSPTEGLSGAVRLRFHHPGQRLVAPSGAPPKAQVAALACGSPTQGSA